MWAFISFFVKSGCMTALLFSYSALAETARTITPPDVFQHVARVHEELALLRFHMGKPAAIKQHQFITITGVAPREVYFQALTLYDKSNQFVFDHQRTRSMPISVPNHAIKPVDVFNVVNLSLEKVRAVKAHLNISTTINEPVLDNTKTPTDVLISVIGANREINTLLDQQFTPKHVFKEVTLAIGYTAQILSSFPNIEHIPSAEPIQAGIKPSDVYERLLGCYERIRIIAKRSNIKMLTLLVNVEKLNIVPSDVYDIASLVVSELAFIHSISAGLSPPRDTYDSGRKFPSHVYQRVSILEAQIKLLEIATKNAPNWLASRSIKASN